MMAPSQVGSWSSGLPPRVSPLEHPDSAFDLVAVFYLQLPADQRRTAFGAAARAVAPGGTLLVVGHDTTNLTDGWGGPHDATVLYSPGDVVADIDDLEITKAEKVERPVLTAEGTKTAVDALVRAIKHV
jgi:hypothetical protein